MPSLPRVPPVAARAPPPRISRTNPCSAPARPRLGARSVAAPRLPAGTARGTPGRRPLSAPATAPLPALPRVIEPRAPLAAVLGPPRRPVTVAVELPGRPLTAAVEPPDGLLAAVGGRLIAPNVELPHRLLKGPVAGRPPGPVTVAIPRLVPGLPGRAAPRPALRP